ncbi:glycosyltransferase family 9 protein [Alteromonas gilva]|uniref:Glycosyltransferase family 9 protein n=1 Tax=Alteromonas gilva TaxID=2987522 RepID=A0ABT5L480_9ALTE|nr:glycosyltransferase family 9 protein [Alteromonas gilva]MDC8831839.1 glycosyltransferase family 9 protein [Alteromonas gilva]
MSAVTKLPQNSRICILRLSAIGDVCHAAALVNRIRTTRPDIRITWIIGKIEYQLMKGLEGVEFIIYDKKTGRQGMKAIREQFKAVRFDALFIMQIALRANLLSRAIRAAVRLGFDKKRSKEGHSLFINKRIAPQRHPHVLEGFMAFADAVGIPPVPTPAWALPLSDQDYAKGLQLANERQYAVISPAASKAERNWHADGYAAVANYLAKRGLAVILCGGPGPLDRQIGDAIIAAGAPVSHDLIGQTSLKELAGVLASARLVIAPDTGPAHMATCVGTAVIGLYAHSNPRRTGPYNNLDNVVSAYDYHIKQQTGKDWQQLPWGSRAKGESLMTTITPEQVYAAIDKLLPPDSIE